MVFRLIFKSIWKEDSFQIIYEKFRNDENKIIDTGEIIFANLIADTDYQLYKHEYEKIKLIF